jgi:hypothetical protein
MQQQQQSNNMTTTYVEPNKCFEEKEEEEEEEEENQDEINASFQHLIDLELEEEVLEINCCIVCKKHISNWSNFCSAMCENKFNEDNAVIIQVDNIVKT